MNEQVCIFEKYVIFMTRINLERFVSKQMHK